MKDYLYFGRKHGAAANMNLYSFDNDNGCKVKNEKYNSYSTGNIWSTQQYKVKSFTIVNVVVFMLGHRLFDYVRRPSY